MIKIVIYCVFCGDSVYIGRSNNIRQRMVQHGHPPFWAILETIEDENQEEADRRGEERETFWTKQFESFGVVLLNKRSPVRFRGKPRPLKKLAFLNEAIQAHGDSDACLIWPYSATGENGYGQVPVGNGKNEYAHRLAWKKAHPGEIIPEGMDVRHGDECSRRCFNQKHLKLGTRQQNMDDAKRLGRMKGPGVKTAGESNGRHKLTAAKATRVRELYASGMSQRQIARKMGVCRGTIQFITSGKNWAHLLPKAVKP
jgi:hypothetical protein